MYTTMAVVLVIPPSSACVTETRSRDDIHSYLNWLKVKSIQGLNINAGRETFAPAPQAVLGHLKSEVGRNSL